MSNKETPPYDMSIHSNPSAMAWTKFFRECRPECNLDDVTMLGWFAYAMMAMHDHIYQTSPPTREPLSDDKLLKIALSVAIQLGVHDIDKKDLKKAGVFELARAIEKAHGITGVADE